MSDSLSTLVNAIPLPSVMVASSERIVNMNSAAMELFGDKIIGRHYITALRQPTILDAIERTLADRDTRRSRYLTHEAGRDVTFDVSFAHVEIHEFHGALITFQDITHMEEAGQMRRDFVANVSHELRTPLTALLGFIETLRGPARDDKAARDRFLGIMQSEAERMNRLVRDLLSLSRVEGEERMRPSGLVDLAGQLESTVRVLRPMAEQSDVTLVLNVADRPVNAPADADQIMQVFTNLIENAIKYGGAGGEVEVSLTIDDADRDLRRSAAIVSVKDHGPGIDTLHLPRLTERFYRIDAHRSRGLGGTGLGLAIVKHIVNRHRGRLRVESILGEGTTFTVKLPLA